MPSVPTATITHAIPRPSSLDGQATPCQVKQRQRSTMKFPPFTHSQKPVLQPNKGLQPTQSSRTKFDFPIAIIRHSSRIG